jgi:thiol-disulfide isomerase/thioredoxin
MDQRISPEQHARESVVSFTRDSSSSFSSTSLRTLYTSLGRQLMRYNDSSFASNYYSMSLVLIDATSDSLTVSWTGATGGSEKYVLQYRRSNEENFQTLSDRLASNQARKKHLEDTDNHGFIFRAKLVTEPDDDGAWMTHSEPFHLLSQQDDLKKMSPPTVSLGGANQTLLIQWMASTETNTTGYELQMRENIGGEPWKSIAASLQGREVRKKNLTSKHGYQFRVRPVSSDDVSTWPFSSPSDAAVAIGLSDGLKSLFKSLDKGTLLGSSSDQPIPLSDALGGKEFVLLYASAHWCGPCRQATPLLANWYNSLGLSKPIEVVFLSADHDERSFQDYFKSMPWLAIDFDDDGREQLMSFLQVSGIPQLAVIDARTGRIIEKNAIGKPFDISRWRSLAAAN